jgi:hypothetical protein
MRPTQLNQQQSNQVDTKTLTHTIQISNNTPATPDTTHGIRDMTRLRDVLPQNPNRVRDPPNPLHRADPTGPKDDKRAVDTPNKTFSPHTPEQNLTSEHRRRPGWLTTPHGGSGLLRKEVIQPHLPVRLPCYDFVLIASPTFDHSLRKTGWAAGFGCCQLS